MGFAFLALVIGYLPLISQAFSRREVNISMLDARAGSPPTAAQLLARPPIRLAERLAIAPKQVTGGKVQGTVSFALPLHPDVKPDDEAES